MLAGSAPVPPTPLKPPVPEDELGLSVTEVVDEAALLEALATGRLRGAGLDAFAQEPLPADHPLRRSPRLVLTPHIGGSTEVALDSVSLGAAETAVRVLRGQPVDPALCVNPAVLTSVNSESAQ